jgi:hypothetical protein
MTDDLARENVELRMQVAGLIRLLPAPTRRAYEGAKVLARTLDRYRRAGYAPEAALKAARAVLAWPSSTFYRRLRLVPVVTVPMAIIPDRFHPPTPPMEG